MLFFNTPLTSQKLPIDILVWDANIKTANLACRENIGYLEAVGQIQQIRVKFSDYFIFLYVF